MTFRFYGLLNRCRLNQRSWKHEETYVLNVALINYMAFIDLQKSLNQAPIIFCCRMSRKN